MTLDERIKQLQLSIDKDKRKLKHLLLKKDLEDNKNMGQTTIEDYLKE